MSVVDVVEKSIADRFECIGECILVRRLEKEDDITPGGIHKPQIARQKSTRGEVVAVGEGRVVGGIWMPMNLKPGDIVLFSRYADGTEVMIDGEIYLKFHWKQIHLREKCAEPSNA